MRIPGPAYYVAGATKLLGRFGFLGAALGSRLRESALVAAPFLSRAGTGTRCEGLTKL